MLKAMRKNVKSLAPTLWFVIIAFIISIFAVWGGAGRLGEARTTNTIATVGDEKIQADFYYQSLYQRLEALKQEFADLDQNFIQQLNIPQQVLEQIIQQTVLLQVAEDLGILASSSEIRSKIMSFPVFQKDGKFVGFEEYQRILNWNRLSASEFEKSLVKDIITEKTIEFLTAGIAISQEELWENYKKNNESAQLEYLVIEADKMKIEEEIEDDVLQEYFMNNQEKHKISERRSADFIFLSTEDMKSDLELTDSEIDDYYKDNQSQFTEPEKIRVSRIFLSSTDKEKNQVLTEAQNIHDRINQGEDFEQLAKNLSQDEKAETGGDWGLYEWKRLPAAEQQAIQDLSQGEVSNVIEGEDGVSLLKMTEKVPPVQKALEEVRERIKTILVDQKAKEVVDLKIAQLQKNAQKEKSLDVAAQKLGYKIKDTGPLEEGEAIVDIDPSGSISRILFSLEEGEISSPAYTYKGTGLAQLQKIEPSRPATFEEVKEDVEEEFRKERKKETARELATSLKTKLQTRSFEQIATQHSLEYKTAEEHKRGQYLGIIGENAKVDELAFSSPLNKINDPIEFKDGYVVLQTLGRKEVTREDLEKEREKERESLLDLKRNKFFQSLYSKLREEKEVKTNYDLFLQINSDVLARYQR